MSAGVLLEGLAVGALGALATVAMQRRSGARPPAPTDSLRSRFPWLPSLALAVGLGALGWLASGWPAAGLWAAAAGWAIPRLRAAERRRSSAVEALEARAAWVSLVRGQLAGGASLARALQVACERGPARLRDELRPLAAALEEHPVTQAVAAWRASGPADPELYAILSVAASGFGGQVSEVLAQAAEHLRASALAARRLERERRRVRIAGRVVAGLVALWVVAGARLDPTLFASAYAGASGQLLLWLVLAPTAIGVALLARLDRGLEVRP